MKLVAYILILISVATAQNNIIEPLIIRYANPTYATLLDGSTQYWSKATPEWLPYNGVELLLDPTFETNVTNWSATGGSIARDTTTKRTGAGSLKGTATGGSDMQIISSSTIDGTTNKFTLEAWVYVPSANVSKTVRISFNGVADGSAVVLAADTWTKLSFNKANNGGNLSLIVKLVNASAGDVIYVDDASLKLMTSSMDLNGPQLVSNGTFDSNVTGWSAINGATLAHNTTIKRTGAGAAKVTSGGAAYSGMQLSTRISDASSNKFTYECWIYTPAANVQKRIYFEATANGGIVMGSTAITCVADTWTKFAFTVQAPGTQTQIYINLTFNNTSTSGDIFYVDDVSVTKAYDAMVLGLVNLSASAPAAAANILQNRKSGGLPIFDLNVDAGVNLRFILRDTDGLQLTDYTTVLPMNDGRWHLVAATINRLGGAGSMVLYKDTATSSTTVSTSTGKVVFNDENLNIGADFTPANYFQGYIGQIQIVKFTALPSDINQILRRISSTWKRSGFPTAYSNGQIVAWYEWRSRGFDKSGSGNHLSSTGSPNIYTVQP